MNDIAQQNLTEPAQVDWDGYGKSGYVAPPPALDQAGKPIVYEGKAVNVTEDEPDTIDGNAYLNYKLDPIVITSPEASGYEIRFTRASTRPYMTGPIGAKVPKKGNPNRLADYLRSSGATAKPQLNSEYRATVNLVKAKPFKFTIDWEAYNKETGESIKGFLAFPVDPVTGQRKSILHAGDVVNEVDSKGNIVGSKTVKSDVLFANARLRFFRDVKQAK